MVKAAKTAKKKIGRPASDPDDVRSERTAMRMHPDLQTELTAAARENGLTRSLFIERILLAYVNQRLIGRNARLLDGIGRYMTDEEMERLSSGVAQGGNFADLSANYGPIVRPSPVFSGSPRWTSAAQVKKTRK